MTKFVFMNPQSYEQIYVNTSHVPESQHHFMIPNMRVGLLKIEDKVVQVEMPQTVEGEQTGLPETDAHGLAAALGDLAGGSLLVGAVYWFVYLRRRPGR